MNKELYDLIVNGNYFTHSIGKVSDKNTFVKLESILKLEGLYSKDSLRKLGIHVDGRVSGPIRITKDSYVSLFDILNPSLQKRLLSSKFNTFFPLDTKDIIFLVDSSILFQPYVKRSDFDCHEIIARDKIPFDYLFGIIVPSDEGVIKVVNRLFQTYNVDLPIYDFDGNTIALQYKYR